MRRKCNRLLAAAATVVMVLSMAACSSSGSSSSSGETSSSAGTGTNAGRGRAPSISAATPSVGSSESVPPAENPASSEGSGVSASVPPASSVSSSVSLPANSSGKYANVREMMADPDVKKELEEICASYEGTGMEVWVDPVGTDTLVFTYALDPAANGISEINDEIVKVLAASIDEALYADSMENTVKSIIISSLQPTLGTDLKITFAYELSDGTKLTSRTFTANGGETKNPGASSGSSGSTAAVQKYANVRDMMADPDVKKGLDDLYATYQGTGTELWVDAVGTDTLVFTYVMDPAANGIEQVTPEVVKALSENIDAALKSADLETTVKSLITDSFQPYLDVDLKITYTYKLTDGTELASRTYTAK